MTTTSDEVLGAVRARYAAGAGSRVPELCCPVDYAAPLLEVLPAEILERDYGCGDPSRYVRPGDRVLDLGSGAGKICYLASQLTGAGGSVVGVDATPEMLALAREHRASVAAKIGWDNVAFKRGHIQDLALDLDLLERWLAAHPVRGVEDLEALRAEEARLRREAPLVPDGSIDLVLSNCVLNLVAAGDKRRMFAEIHRVLARGGRCAISDIVSDEDVPAALQRDPELWTGCISGAMREDRFLDAFAEAGLYGVEIAAYQTEPWAVVEGIEFRSMTVTAWKGKEGPCRDHGEAVIYRGPWKSVEDDDGHVLRRGVRTAVCRKTFELYSRPPYAACCEPKPPRTAVSDTEAVDFDCAAGTLRAPQTSKRAAVPASSAAPGANSDAGSCCAPGDCC